MFQKWLRRNSASFWSHEEEIYPGEYSDDTQLLIAAARAYSTVRIGANSLLKLNYQPG